MFWKENKFGTSSWEGEVVDSIGFPIDICSEVVALLQHLTIFSLAIKKVNTIKQHLKIFIFPSCKPDFSMSMDDSATTRLTMESILFFSGAHRILSCLDVWMSIFRINDQYN